MFNIVKRIALWQQVIAAGFSLTKVKSIDTDDGYCWHATLCAGKASIVTVSNGGFGGPDEFYYFNSTRENVFTALKPLFSLALVQEHFQANLIRMAEWSLDSGKYTAEEFEAKKLAIQNNEYVVDDDMLGILVDELRATKEQLASLKRKLKGKIAWFEKGKENEHSFITIAYEDTPENRTQLLSKYPEISIFINDLIKVI